MKNNIEIHAEDHTSGKCEVYFLGVDEKWYVSKMTSEEAQTLLTIKQKHQFFEGKFKFEIGDYDLQLLRQGEYLAEINKSRK